MYRGAVMDAIPTPKPTKILPTMRNHGDGARAITIAPIKNKTSDIKIDFFRPKLSFIHPPNAAPIIAPATAILTIVSCKTNKIKYQVNHLQMESEKKHIPSSLDACID